MTTNLETVIAMKPNAIISIAYDVNAMVGIFEKVRDAGIKLVFFECAPTGFVSGQDYYALVSTDYYGSGRFAAEYMAYLLNYEGTVTMVYYDADVWTCNERDERVPQGQWTSIRTSRIVSEQASQSLAAGTSPTRSLRSIPMWMASTPRGTFRQRKLWLPPPPSAAMT